VGPVPFLSEAAYAARNGPRSAERASELGEDRQVGVLETACFMPALRSVRCGAADGTFQTEGMDALGAASLLTGPASV